MGKRCIRFGEARRGDDSLGKSNRSEFVPEIIRFRRGDSFEKSVANESGDRVWIPACAGITGREGASAFAEFLTYMALLKEGSRGGEVTAMGGWQWGRGREWKIGRGGGRFFTSLRYVQNDMWGCAALGRTEGASGAGSSLGMGPRLLSSPGLAPRGEGDSSQWEDGSGGRGWRDGEDRFFTSLRYVQNDMLWCEGGWVPASARTRGLGVDSRFRLHGGGTCAGGRGWGWVPDPRLHGGRISTRGQRVGDWGRGAGGSRTAPTEGEYCRALGSPPSPVFTRAGSDLPPSRGKGFVGDERAIFIVMTCGGCAALRSEGQPGRRRCLGGAIVA